MAKNQSIFQKDLLLGDKQSKLIKSGWESKQCSKTKDCKSGGYNLEQCQGKDQRLLSLILLIGSIHFRQIESNSQ
jgi:hypothetical protein